jgi:hypothetical protein
VRSGRWLRLLDAVAAAAVVAIATGWLLKTPFSTDGWARRDLNDYTLNLRHSDAVAQTREYAFGFTYPPPSVLFRVALGKLGFEIGGGTWISLSGVSLLLAVVTSLKLADRWNRPGWGVLPLTALVLVKYPFEFEFKYLNCNAMFLALALAAAWQVDRRPLLAGFLMSLSVALKLYSVVFIPWLFLTKRVKAAIATLGFSTIWFVAIPSLFWGWNGALEVSQSWLHRVWETGMADFPIRYDSNAYLVSLHAATLAAVSRLTEFRSLEIAHYMSGVLQALWVISVVIALSIRQSRQRDRGFDADVALLLLLPLPLSGQLQPHHAVVLLPSAVLLLGVAADRERSTSLRVLSTVAVLGAFLLLEFGPPRPWRGIALHAAMVLHVLGLFGLNAASRK